MLQTFVKTLIRKGFEIGMEPTIFSVNYGNRQGNIEVEIDLCGDVNIQVEGAPHQEAFAGKDLMELFAEMETHGGHEIKPVSGNLYHVSRRRVGDKGGRFMGVFYITPESDSKSAKMVLEAKSAEAVYTKICEEAGIPVTEITDSEIRAYVGESYFWV